MAEIVLYLDDGFSGFHTHLFETMLDLTTLHIAGVGSGVDDGGETWNDKASSFVIISGVWRLFADVNRGRPLGDFGPGIYSNLPSGVPNDVLSGVELLQETALTASWTHGNVTELEVQNDASVTKTPRGWGAEFSFPSNSSAWLHVPVPTPVLNSDARATVFRFFLLFSCDPNFGFIDTVQLYDGPNMIQSFGDLFLGGTAFMNQIVSQNTFLLSEPHSVVFGLSISFHYTGTEKGQSTLTVSTAGCDFHFAP